MPLDVPAHVQPAHYVENHVQVEAGNNWDVSRRARVTPIAEVVEEPLPFEAPAEIVPPAPRFTADDQVPLEDPVAVVHFTHEGITIGRADQSALHALDKNVPLIVVAHGDKDESDANRLSRIRAKAVTTLLRAKGFTVTTVKAFGNTRPAVAGGAEENRTVAVYAAPQIEAPEA